MLPVPQNTCTSTSWDNFRQNMDTEAEHFCTYHIQLKLQIRERKSMRKYMQASKFYKGVDL